MNNILLKHSLTAKYQSLFNKAGVNTVLRLAHFFGQASHESNLKPTVESLNYAVKGLLDNFGRHRISIIEANKYGRTATQKANQEMIANIIYGGKWGAENLGNTQTGDGWKFRGRGIFQITGRANYQALTGYATKVLGLNVDYVANPDLLLNEADSLIAALWYWNNRQMNQYADSNNVLAVSKIINLGNAKAKGTPKGLDDRENKTEAFQKLFAA
ncbi:putative chitinase [Chryseobacterium rhizosphaerae]|uniref:glycoside hydrolase family 19 protein n=1 Tax=Chryseobacterium rhizosphaerae TaxID=395937 RepID=UPI0028676613|nr:hypothetical protein [Chryseobacterium rhizosphaerae]MDR6548554.1 putative chitinase [Chryseobacterium rhizosphaerae]